VDYIFTALFCNGAEYNGIVCVCVCVCVIARDILARDFDGLHSHLLSLDVFLVLFSDLLLISHKGFSDLLTG